MLLIASYTKQNSYTISSILLSICAMKNFIPLVFDLLTLLEDTYKIYLKNGRIMAFLLLLIISINTLLYLCNHFSLKNILTDLIINQSGLLTGLAGTPEFNGILIGFQEDIKLLFGLEWIYVLIVSIISLFFAISTTLASASIHGGKNIGINYLVLVTLRSWKRPFVTSFYLVLFSIGYFWFWIATMLPVFLFLGFKVITSKLISFPLLLSYTVLYTYLCVVFNLSLVISILEEKFGIEALGKAAQIVKGMKLQGFLLNLVFGILSLILSMGLRFINLKQSEVFQVVLKLLVVNSILIVRIFVYTANTVFYYHCKKAHGEEAELDTDVEYTKIPAVPVLNENIP